MPGTHAKNRNHENTRKSTNAFLGAFVHFRGSFLKKQEKRFKLWWQGLCKLHSLSIFRMRECESFGVKELPAKFLDRLSDLYVAGRIISTFVVDRVTDDRVIYGRKMDADLMCPAGFNIDVEKRELLETLADLPER